MEEVKVEELDLYEILEIQPASNVSETKKAYRKKALQCHPDKNPDNPNAAKEFHQLSKILEILIDETARKAYDAVLKGRKEAALRHKELDSKRRKLKEDLEAREKVASANYKRKTADEKLREEIARLRKEGSKQVEEESEKIQQEIMQQKKQNLESDWNSANYRIKIKWNVAKEDTTNGGYAYDMLHRFLSKYGDVNGLVLSQKKLGSAIVEFGTRKGAEMAIEMECGLPSNPLKMEWVNPPPTKRNSAPSYLAKPSDYESLILTKMRQAEERRRLIEQMKAEEMDGDMMASDDGKKKQEIEKRKETDISDEKMAQGYTNLVDNVANKFSGKTKKNRNRNKFLKPRKDF